MQEITIPEGHKATILGGTIRIEPIEKVQEPKFKRGDIIRWEGLGVFTGFILGVSDCIDCYKCYDPINDKSPYCPNSCHKSMLRLATPEEQQILFDALAKEGKYWDAEALEVKDFIKVPESIGIYKDELQLDAFGDGLFIGFNENKQVLGSYDGLYTVDIIDDYFNKVQCYLQPCKMEDLKAGDTAFFSPTFRPAEDITSDLGRYVKVIGKYNYKTNKSGEIVQERNHTEWWYKLIPINN